MKEQRKPRDFWIEEGGESFGSHYEPDKIYYKKTKGAIHVRELNSDGIDVETIRRVCEWIRKEQNWMEAECGSAEEIERQFLGVE